MLAFDEKGHLTPYNINELTLAEFEAFFVEGLDDRAHRRGLFADFLKFLKEVRASFNLPFNLYLGGSFVTTKPEPNDMDVVVFVDYDLLVKRSDVVLNMTKSSPKKYRMDVHFAPFAKRRHRFYDKTLAIEKDWMDIYGRSRPENGIRYPKGIIKINFLP